MEEGKEQEEEEEETEKVTKKMKREQLLPSSTTFHSESTRALYLFFLFASDLIQLEIEKLNRDRDGRKKN